MEGRSSTPTSTARTPSRRRSTRASRCSGSGRSPGASRARCSSAPRRRSARRTRASRPSACSSAPRSRATCRATSTPRWPRSPTARRTSTAAGGKYWYDLQANISRRAKDQAERLHNEDVWAEIARAPRRPGARPAATSPASTSARRTRPTSPTPTRRGWSSCTPSSRTSAASATPTRSRSPRARPSTAARRTGRTATCSSTSPATATASRSSTRSVREYLGWSESSPSEDDLDLTTSQRTRPTERQTQGRARRPTRACWAPTSGRSSRAARPGSRSTIAERKVEGQAPSLAERVSRRLGNDGALNTPAGGLADPARPSTAVPKLWEDGHVCVGDLWRLYAEYPYMPRLRDRRCSTAACSTGPLLWETEGFALADGYDARPRYSALVCRQTVSYRPGHRRDADRAGPSARRRSGGRGP